MIFPMPCPKSLLPVHGIMSKDPIAVPSAQIDLGYVDPPQNGIDQKHLARRLPSRPSLPLWIEVDVLSFAEQSIDRPKCLD